MWHGQPGRPIQVTLIYTTLRYSLFPVILRLKPKLPTSFINAEQGVVWAFGRGILDAREAQRNNLRVGFAYGRVLVESSSAVPVSYSKGAAHRVGNEILVVPRVLRLEALAYRLRAISSIDITE